MLGTRLSRIVVGRASVAIAVGYSSIVFLLWLLQWWISEAVPGMGLVKSFLHLMLLPCVIVVVIFLLTRQWRSVLGVAPAVIAFLFSYGLFLLPRSGVASPDVSTLRILTFNLQVPGEQEVTAIADIIDTVDADLVALQELSPEAAVQFGTTLKNSYPFQALHPSQEDHSGQGVLSRYPIDSDHYWRYGGIPHSLGHQRVELTIDGAEIVLYNSHVVPPITMNNFHPTAHLRALQEVLQRAREESKPLLWAGDFNMTDQFHSYREITSEYVDAYRQVGDVGFGFTFPDADTPVLPPFLRLDYIFYSNEFDGVAADVWQDSGPSDHKPLVARLTLKRSAALLGAD